MLKCAKKKKKLWKERKKDLTAPALLEMDDFGVYQALRPLLVITPVINTYAQISGRPVCTNQR